MRGNGRHIARMPAGDGRYEEELFDLGADPHETDNLIDERPDRATPLREDLLRFLSEPSGPHQEPEALDAEELEALRSLGYAGRG